MCYEIAMASSDMVSCRFVLRCAARFSRSAFASRSGARLIRIRCLQNSAFSISRGRRRNRRITFSDLQSKRVARLTGISKDFFRTQSHRLAG
jgi:hypothetical protein